MVFGDHHNHYHHSMINELIDASGHSQTKNIQFNSSIEIFTNQTNSFLEYEQKKKSEKD